MKSIKNKDERPQSGQSVIGFDETGNYKSVIYRGDSNRFFDDNGAVWPLEKMNRWYIKIPLTDEQKAKVKAITIKDVNYTADSYSLERSIWIILEAGYINEDGDLKVEYSPSTTECNLIDRICKVVGIPRKFRYKN